MTAIPGTVPNTTLPTGGDADGPAGRRPGTVARIRSAAIRYWPSMAVYGVAKGLGFAVFMLLLRISTAYRHKNPRYGGGRHPWDVLASWDGWWYRQVAQSCYDPKLTRASKR